ncbi:MAG: DMT family transporter [Candidatus Eisenbacteria bacterium]|nr:DMT family transporter [Candidatus Eisenbacteria bacterium]
MRLPPTTLLALLTVQVVFAVHYVAAKMVVEFVPPRAWALVRVAAAAAILLALARARAPRTRVTRRDLASLAFFALFGVVINQVSFTEGIQRTTPAHSSLINTLIPVSTFLFALLLRGESLTFRKGAGLGLAFLGVLVLLRVHEFTFSERWVKGDLLTLLNAFSFGFFLAVSRNTVRRYPPLVSTAYTMAFGAVGIALVGAPAALRFDWLSLPASTVLVMAGIVLFATVLNYVLNYYALSRVDSSTVALFIYLQPLLATLLSVGLGRESLSPRFGASALLVFAGVYLVARAPHPTPRAKILEAE